MTRITIERSHSLGLDEARQRAQALADRLASQYDVRCSWNGDCLEFRRSGADGRIEVGDDSVRVELKLGLLLSALGSTIRREIETTLDKSLKA
jgi:putative polyhydroxyalkanoate system protein